VRPNGSTSLTILTITIHPAIDKVITIPRLRANDMARGQIDMVYGGGKGNNAARALTRLNVPVIASGFQGGYAGQYITQELGKEGIRTDFVDCSQPTRTTLLIHEKETRKVFAIYEPGQEVEPGEIERLKQTFRRWIETCELCLLCGSAQTPATIPIFGELIELAKRENVDCVLDSSGAALSRGIAARPYMVKVNGEELAGHVGHELKNLEEQILAIQQLQATGIQLVALSLGSEGALLTDNNHTWQGSLKMEQVVNVMGCGDSLLAGMVTGIVQHASPVDILRLGIACGAANTQAMGAGFIDPKLVEQLMPLVDIRQL
jgi:tagatose 6-phosphate kinase